MAGDGQRPSAAEIRQLRRNERRYEALIAATAQITWTTNAEGSAEEDSPTWRAYTGQTVEQMRGKGFIEAIHPDDRAAVNAAWQRASATQTTYTVQYRVRRFDGEYRIFLARGAPVLEDGVVQEWVGCCSDITEQQATLETLRKSEAHVRSLIEQAPDPIFITDGDGRYLDVNPSACRLLGYTRTELLSMSTRDVIAPNDVARADEARTHLLTHSLQISDWQLRRKDGSFVTVEMHSTVLVDGRWQAIARDISERQRLERAVAEQAREAAARAAQLEAVFDALADGIYLYGADGQLLDTNVAARQYNPRTTDASYLASPLAGRIRQFAPRDGEGRPLAFDDLPVQRLLRGETLAGDQTIDNLLYNPETGTDVLLNVAGAPVRDAAGQVVGAVVVTRDVTERRALEREVQEQRDLAEGIIDTTPFAVALFDATDDFRCLRHNASTLALVGPQWQARGSLVGHPIADVLDANAAAQVSTLLAQVRDTGQQIVVEELAASTPPELRTRWYKFSVSPLHNAEGQVRALLASAIEITEQVETRLARQREAARLQAMLEVLPVGVSISNATGGITQMNAAFRSIWGEAAPLVQHVAEYRRYQGWWPDGRQVAPDEWALAVALAEGRAVPDQEVHIQTFDGKRKIVYNAAVPIRSADGAIIGGVVVTSDITERMALEHRTQASLDALLRMAQAVVGATTATTPMTTSPAFLGNTGQPNGATYLAARELARVTREVLACRRVGVMAVDAETQRMQPLAVEGLSPDEEAQWWAMQPQDAQYGEGIEPDARAQLDAGEVLLFDLTQPPYDQQPNPFGITTVLVAPMRLNGRIVGILSLDHAGERHTYTEQELALARGVADLAALLVERERLAAAHAASQARAMALAETNAQMHTFVGIAGHELRTPVTGIKSSVQMAARVVRQALDVDLPSPLATRLARAVGLLDGVNNQADRLNRLIRDLLDVTRIQTGALDLHPAAIDLAAVVREVIEPLRLEWRTRTIELHVPRGTVPLWGDADRLGQVVSNLVTNALKYSPEDQPVRVSLEATASEARLSVTDHGPGLSAGQQSQLFQAFSRVEGIDPQSGAAVGLGLGLYICKTIVEGHSGQLGVTSQAGRGATFWCSIPLTPEYQQTPHQEA